MAINIPLKAVAFVLYTLALLGGAFGISYGVFEWRDDDEEKDAAPEITAEAEKSFSMTLESDEDFREAARRVEALMPEFDCAGEFLGNPERGSPRGTLACDAGLTGFSCEFRPGTLNLIDCSSEQSAPAGFPGCTVERKAAARYLVFCSGPGTNAFCEVLGPTLRVTCQRA